MVQIGYILAESQTVLRFKARSVSEIDAISCSMLPHLRVYTVIF